MTFAVPVIIGRVTNGYWETVSLWNVFWLRQEKERRYRLRAEGFTFERVLARVSALLDIDMDDVLWTQPSVTRT